MRAVWVKSPAGSGEYFFFCLTSTGSGRNKAIQKRKTNTLVSEKEGTIFIPIIEFRETTSAPSFASSVVRDARETARRKNDISKSLGRRSCVGLVSSFPGGGLRI